MLGDVISLCSRSSQSLQDSSAHLNVAGKIYGRALLAGLQE
jgi:hypothetical protein